MNALLQTHLTRLESSLDALVDSITTYNPSPPLATRLLAADADLAAALDTLSTHQRNARSLQSLRSTAAALDARIRATLGALADTRKELSPPELAPRADVAIADGPTAADAQEIDYALLLSTAQRIAPFTRPPVRLSDDDSAAGQPRVLDAQQAAYLDPRRAAAAAFTPWPGDAAIWAGALGRLGGRGEGEGEGAGVAAATRDDDGVEDNRDTGVNGVVPAAAPAQAEAPTREDVERRRAEAEARRRQQEEELGGFELYNPDED